jgi:hypothetical protein
VPVAEGSLLTFDTMAQAYLEDYVLQRYRTLSTARARVEHRRGFFGGWRVDAITPDSLRNYQMSSRAEDRGLDRESGDVSPEPDVPVGDPSRAVGADATLSETVGGEPAT